jgi:hypothetical protein
MAKLTTSGAHEVVRTVVKAPGSTYTYTLALRSDAVILRKLNSGGAGFKVWYRVPRELNATLNRELLVSVAQHYGYVEA